VTRQDASPSPAGTPDHAGIARRLAGCWCSSALGGQGQDVTWSKGYDPCIPRAGHAAPARITARPVRLGDGALLAARRPERDGGRWQRPVLLRRFGRSTAPAWPTQRQARVIHRYRRVFRDGAYCLPLLGVRPRASDVTGATYASAVSETAICGCVGTSGLRTSGSAGLQIPARLLNIGQLTDVSHCKLHQYLCCNYEIKCQTDLPGWPCRVTWLSPDRFTPAW